MWLDGRMIDMNRIEELRGEIGADELGLVLALFLEEARETIEQLEAGLERCELSRAMHFLQGSALNMGLSGFADAAATIKAEREGDPVAAAARLRVILERTSADVSALAT